MLCLDWSETGVEKKNNPGTATLKKKKKKETGETGVTTHGYDPIKHVSQKNFKFVPL